MAAQVKTCALRSGSSGNSILVSDGSTRLLVDAGVCARTIEQSLQEIGESSAAINGILVTHEHSDHIAGVGVMMRRYKIPVYANKATWQAMHPTLGKIDESLIHILETGRKTVVGNLALTSFSTPHDAVDSVGYRIATAQGDISVFTDVGSLQDHLLEAVAGSRIVYIEANYDHAML
ncbi:MAG TPA: MBL fold metallo-hydrolase, partial [Clostridiales bacterium]|nr:MBL fold metallo-hydrolase [Clostridiales bacterium]